MARSAPWFLAALFAACTTAPAQEIITANPTSTLASVGSLPGICRTSGRNSYLFFTMVSESQFSLLSNVSVTGSEAEATVYFDDPNTPAVESIALAAMSSNGTLSVGLRDANATAPGTVILFADDASGGYDFTFLYGVDNTTRVWDIPLSVFNTVDGSHIKDLAFVVANGFVTNPVVDLYCYFHGHPFAPTAASSTSLTGATLLASVTLGSRTAFPPVAVSAQVNDGVVTSLVAGATNFIAGYRLTNLAGKVTVQVDRGTMGEVAFDGVVLDTNGLPRFQFPPVTGNLYVVETTTNLTTWETNILVAGTNGLVLATNASDSAAGYTRIASKLFPAQAMGDAFAIVGRLPSGVACLVELVDTQSNTVPFWIFGLSAARRYTLANDTNAIPASFQTNAIDKIRFTIPRTYTNYPSGLRATNTSATGAIDIRFPNGIGAVAPPRN